MELLLLLLLFICEVLLVGSLLLPLRCEGLFDVKADRVETELELRYNLTGFVQSVFMFFMLLELSRELFSSIWMNCL